MKAAPVIIATGGANLASLQFALQRLGVDATVTEKAEQIREASHVFLPGVGTARDAMERLDAAKLSRIIPQLTQPVLGICLGMQLLFSSSEEDNTDCLNIISSRAYRFVKNSDLRVPQMGWNQIWFNGDSKLLTGIENGAYAYFIHSYALPLVAWTRATANYGAPFSAVVEKNNFYGTQFHPERSAGLGSHILENFLAL